MWRYRYSVFTVYDTYNVISLDQQFAFLHKYFMNYVRSAQWLFRGFYLY